MRTASLPNVNPCALRSPRTASSTFGKRLGERREEMSMNDDMNMRIFRLHNENHEIDV